VPGPWEQRRPAEITSLRPPVGKRFGATGPDLGYGLKLAHLVGERAVLADGEETDDAVAGCFATGCRRSSHFHRAPVIGDMEWSFALWGFLPGAPEALVHFRRPRFTGVANDYSRQRALVDLVQEDALRLRPAEVQEGLSTNWRRWLGTEV